MTTAMKKIDILSKTKCVLLSVYEMGYFFGRQIFLSVYYLQTTTTTTKMELFPAEARFSSHCSNFPRIFRFVLFQNQLEEVFNFRVVLKFSEDLLPSLGQLSTFMSKLCPNCKTDLLILSFFSFLLCEYTCVYARLFLRVMNFYLSKWNIKQKQEVKKWTHQTRWFFKIF